MKYLFLLLPLFFIGCASSTQKIAIQSIETTKSVYNSNPQDISFNPAFSIQEKDILSCDVERKKFFYSVIKETSEISDISYDKENHLISIFQSKYKTGFSIETDICKKNGLFFINEENNKYSISYIEVEIPSKIN